jgi:flavin-dependent dehydrogenase
LDKARFPRAKCCAGGLLARTYRQLDFDLPDSVVERRLRNFTMTVGDSTFSYDVGREYGVTVRRERLDAFLVKRAEMAGAEVQDGCKVQKAEEIDQVALTTTSGRFSGRFLVIAEGVTSPTADKVLGPRPAGSLAVGSVLDCMLMEETGNAAGLHLIESPVRRPRFHHYFPTNGALFPTRNSMVLSVVTKGKSQTEIRSALDLMKHQLEKRTSIMGECSKICSHPVPLAAREVLVRGRILAVGDAAGLVSPFSGEGINYAFRSAALAAQAVVAATSNDDRQSLRSYQRAVENEIVPTIKACDVICPWLHWLIGVVDVNKLAEKIEADEDLTATMSSMALGESDWRTLLVRTILRFPQLFFSSLG